MTDGLSRTERRLLQLAQGNGIALLDAFRRTHDDEEAYYLTDGSLTAMAENLAGTSPPLLTLDLSGAAEGQVLWERVSITSAGQSVIAGQRDRVDMCGIDRWLGEYIWRDAVRSGAGMTRTNVTG